MVGQRFLVPFILVRVQVPQLFVASSSESATLKSQKLWELLRRRPWRVKRGRAFLPFNHQCLRLYFFFRYSLPTFCYPLKMHYVYILICSDNTYYVGCTNNLKRRITEHNTSNYGSYHTKLRRPVVLKYYETFPTLIEARRRERELKGWRREKKEGLFGKKW